jgi:putative addiction module component (TIGR02574 family)
MVAKELLDSVIALPVEDRLELLGKLEDSLRNDPTWDAEDLALRQLIEERLDAHERNPGGGSPWEEVEKRIRAKLGPK